MAARYRIGELAAEFGTSYRTLRFYESKGLLAPERRGTMRLYDEADCERLRRILRLARFGFSLAEIRTMLRLEPHGPAMIERLETRRTEMATEIEKLLDARSEMTELLGRLKRFASRAA